MKKIVTMEALQREKKIREEEAITEALLRAGDIDALMAYNGRRCEHVDEKRLARFNTLVRYAEQLKAALPDVLGTRYIWPNERCHTGSVLILFEQLCFRRSFLKPLGLMLLNADEIDLFQRPKEMLTDEESEDPFSLPASRFCICLEMTVLRVYTD